MEGLRKILRDRKPLSNLLKDGKWVGVVVSLLLALFFWFLIVLDSPAGFTKQLRVTLLQPELPGGFVVTDSALYPKKLVVGLHAPGGKLLRFSLRNLFFHPKPFRPEVDTADLRPGGGRLEISAAHLKRQLLRSPSLPKSVKELLPNGYDDLTLSAQSLVLSYEPIQESRAEVLFAGQVDFGESPNLKLTDSVGIIPKVVRLYGPKQKLDSLRNAEDGLFVKTDTAAIKIGNPGHVTLPIALLETKDFRMVPDTVYVSFVTEELMHTSYTSQDIKIHGLDSRHTLRLLPPSVTVTLLATKAGLEDSDYDPMLYVDASRVIGAPTGYRLEVHVGNPPDKSKVEMIQIEPDKLDFILEEKETQSDGK